MSTIIMKTPVLKRRYFPFMPPSEHVKNSIFRHPHNYWSRDSCPWWNSLWSSFRL